MLPPLSALSPAPPAGRGARHDPARGDRPGGGDGREVRAGGGERALLTRGPGLAGPPADAPARPWRAPRSLVEAPATPTPAVGRARVLGLLRPRAGPPGGGRTYPQDRGRIGARAQDVRRAFAAASATRDGTPRGVRRAGPVTAGSLRRPAPTPPAGSP